MYHLAVSEIKVEGFSRNFLYYYTDFTHFADYVLIIFIPCFKIPHTSVQYT